MSRFKAIEDHVGSNSLQDGLSAYFVANVRDAVIPEFADLSCSNRVQDTTHLSELAWILDLTGLYTVPGFVDAVENLRGQNPDNAWDKTDEGKAAPYFDTVLGSIADPLKPTAGQIDYLRFVLAELGRRRRNPIWTMPFNQLQPYLPEGPERWLEVAGVPKDKAGRYIVAVKYPRKHRELYRPCFADGATNAHHFPTPSGVSVDDGGRAMDLSDSPSGFGAIPTRTSLPSLVPTIASTPLPEYIHAHAEFQDAEIVGLGKTDRLVGSLDSVDDYRKRHKQRLINLWPHHAALIGTWPD